MKYLLVLSVFILSGGFINKPDSAKQMLRVNIIGDFRKETIRVEYQNQIFEKIISEAKHTGMFLEISVDENVKDHDQIALRIYRKKHGLFQKFELAFESIYYDEDYSIPVIVSKKYQSAWYNMRVFWVNHSGGFGMRDDFWYPQTKGDSTQFRFNLVATYSILCPD